MIFGMPWVDAFAWAWVPIILGAYFRAQYLDKPWLFMHVNAIGGCIMAFIMYRQGAWQPFYLSLGFSIIGFAGMHRYYYAEWVMRSKAR